jgi:hypothetical protein
MPSRSLDISGKLIRLGAVVRIVGIPDVTSMPAATRAETEPVFRHLLGKCKRVVGIDKRGFVELDFRIRRGRHAGLHSVGIEPHLLRVQRTRRAV